MTLDTNPWIFFGVIAAITGLVVEVGWRLIAMAMNKTKPWIFAPDESGGLGILARARFAQGHIIHGKGDKGKRYPLTYGNRVPTNAGPVFVFGLQTGVNLRPPTLAEVTEGMTATELRSFNMIDPLLQFRTWSRRITQETVDANQEKEDWKKTAILPVAIIAGIAITGLIGAIIALVVKAA